MAEELTFTAGGSRESIYREIEPQIAALIEGERDVTANLANVAAVLKEAGRFFWVGFYIAKEGQLVLGPFQGPVACTRVDFDKGVCGAAYSSRQTTIVPNVDEFPGHIACSSAARSEIVVPIMNEDGTVFGVLDVDSDELNDFGQTDSDALNGIVRNIERAIRSHTHFGSPT